MNPTAEHAAESARAALDRDDWQAALAALRDLSHKDLESAAELIPLPAIYNSKTKKELLSRIEFMLPHSTATVKRERQARSERNLKISEIRDCLRHAHGYAAGHNGPPIVETYRERILRLAAGLPDHPDTEQVRREIAEWDELGRATRERDEAIRLAAIYLPSVPDCNLNDPPGWAVDRVKARIARRIATNP